MAVHRIDHIGINVDDLPAAKAFFLELGLEVKGEAKLEGEFLDTIVALKGARTEFVMMGQPDGQTSLEIIKYHAPADNSGTREAPANARGLRHIAFLIDDLEAVVARLNAMGAQSFSEIQRYEDSYKLVYLRGPEGIIVELAEEIK